VVLHEEEPVVEKRAVPKDRVRLEKDTVTDEREVTEQVRKERIESEGTRVGRSTSSRPAGSVRRRLGADRRAAVRRRLTHFVLEEV
jgi:hypothetical protein